MSVRTILLVAASCTAVSIAPAVQAAESKCTQNRIDGTTPPKTQSMVYPSHSVIPFYQWESNNGYCGEVSMMQAGMNNGQWIPQFNARLLSGTGLLQSGPRGWCKTHNN